MTVDITPAGPPSFSTSALALTKGLNVILSAILRSPFHRKLSQRFMLLSFKGRKSGKRYTLVVGYQREGEVLEVISPRNWWKNLRGENTQVSVLLQGRWYDGIAEAFHGDETVAAGYLRAMQRSPALIGMYHVEVDETGQPKPESVRQATRTCALARIRLLSEKNA
ncbi:MAG: nitroreductase family deazaflavin-dependent oxidoreductase [Ktedonobacteraceae bacterium]|nr:nitroreductase family deazaflavin-dependent oxidoreductase [Ktedonobacteraceae bacterium]